MTAPLRLVTCRVLEEHPIQGKPLGMPQIVIRDHLECGHTFAKNVWASDRGYQPAARRHCATCESEGRS